jgi:predicted enzyme related to lactoylglutathione lyase
VGCSGALVKMPGFASGGNGTLVYFNCADCAVITEEVKDLIRYKNAQRLFQI